MSLALRATSRAICTLFLFTRDIMSISRVPLSFALDTFYMAANANWILVSISARFYWINWFLARGDPNCLLSMV